MPDQDSLEPYLFYGTVLPERAPLSLKYKTPKRISVQTADGESRSLNVHLNIILNQIGVTVEVEQEFERIFDFFKSQETGPNVCFDDANDNRQGKGIVGCRRVDRQQCR
jgi:hypothetical protein